MRSNSEHLLVIGDDKATRDAVSRHLERRGYRVTVAEDDRQALDLIAHQPFDGVLLDVTSPGTGAVEVLAQIQAGDRGAHLPVVVLSADGEIERIAQCLEMGADDYLREPLDPVLLGARVAATLERQRLRKQVQAGLKREEVLAFERDVQIAREIQASFLPESIPQPPGWEIAVSFHPAREVAGDFYDVFPLSNNRRVGFVIADVCDKGVGAALFMGLFRSLIRAFAQQHHTLSWMDALIDDDPVVHATWPGRRRGVPTIGASALRDAIGMTNNYIARTHEQAIMFATVFFGALDPTTGSLLYVNAGHDSPIIVGPGGVRAELEPTGPLVGVIPGETFDIGEAHLDPGDTLLAYTDGVTEARAPDGTFFTEERLMGLVAQPASSAAAIMERVEASVRVFTGDADQYDDITLLGVRRASLL